MMYFVLKRMLDILGSSLGIILFSPIFVVTALAIKLNSPGPVLVEISDRVGERGKVFRMYKFRSMIADAHVKIKEDLKFKKLYKEFEKGFKLNKDPRITRVGKFIRKTSIDELPQLFNVFRGEMSLVGPRALYTEEFALRKKEYPHLRDKLEAALLTKPGVTGLWQISGRSELDFEERITLDAEYADNNSIAQDLIILVKTIPAVIKGRGAQ